MADILEAEHTSYTESKRKWLIFKFFVVTEGLQTRMELVRIWQMISWSDLMFQQAGTNILIVNSW